MDQKMMDLARRFRGSAVHRLGNSRRGAHYVLTEPATKPPRAAASSAGLTCASAIEVIRKHAERIGENPETSPVTPHVAASPPRPHATVRQIERSPRPQVTPAPRVYGRTSRTPRPSPIRRAATSACRRSGFTSTRSIVARCVGRGDVEPGRAAKAVLADARTPAAHHVAPPIDLSRTSPAVSERVI